MQLDFLANTDVGRTSGPPVAGEEDEAASEASEWEAREQAERDWGGGQVGGGALREVAFFFFSHYR